MTLLFFFFPRNIQQALTFLHITPHPLKPPSSSTTDNDRTNMQGMAVRVVLDDPTRDPLIVPHELHTKLKTGLSGNQHVDVICNGIPETQAGVPGRCASSNTHSTPL